MTNQINRLVPNNAPDDLELNFDFKGHALRVFGTRDKPWFVAADVCAALSIVNVSHAVASLDDDERGAHIVSTSTATNQHGGGIVSGDTPSNDFEQQMLVISESGLYALIFKSRKAEAKMFKKWVTSEVLPSIRKTGVFIDKTDRFMTHPIFLQLRREAQEKARSSSAQILKHHLVPHMQRVFCGHGEPKLETVLREVQDFLSNYFIDAGGEPQRVPKPKGPTLDLIHRGRPEAEIRDLHRMMYKHVTNPPETADEMVIRMGDKPSDFYLRVEK